MKRLILTCSAITLAAFWVTSAHATIIGVGQAGPSNLGGNAAKIAAPADALDDDVTNIAMQGFDERQGVVTNAVYMTDGGSIAMGTRVNSHMIFLNTAGNTQGEHFNVTWNFTNLIIGVMSNQSGTFEAASTGQLGALGTNYTVGPALQVPPFPARGIEQNDGVGDGPNDGYLVAGNSITVGMFVTEPGDWIRVVTAASPVPEPGTILLLGSGLAGLGFWRWKKEKSA